MADTNDSQRRRVSVNTAIFATATALSRVAGLAREVIAANFFGTSRVFSAFTIASQIPNLMTNLFAQAALSAAFVPVFTELLQAGRKKEAFRLATTLFWIVGLVLGMITVLGILLAGPVMSIYGDIAGAKNFDVHAATVLTQILFPVVLLLGLSGVLTGILQSYDEFTIPALAPVVWNVVIIVLTLLLKHHTGGVGVYGYAIAWLLATLVQLLLIGSALRLIDYRLGFELDWRDPRIRQVFLLMLPVTLGLGIINLDALINSAMGALVVTHPLPAAGPAAIRYAFLLYMLPQGVFSVAVSTVLFPTLSRQAARGAAAEMRHTVANGMRQINLLLIPSAAGFLVLSVPITRLIFERNAFGPESLALTSRALFWFAFSLPFSGLNLLMTRTFFAFQRPWIPTKLAAINMVVDIIVSVALYKPLGIAGLVIGTAAANIVMAYLQFRRLRIGFNGRLEGHQTLMITARIVVASAVTAAIARVLWVLLNGLLGTSFLGQLLSVGITILVGGGCYAWAVSHMRIPEWRQIEEMFGGMVQRMLNRPARV